MNESIGDELAEATDFEEPLDRGDLMGDVCMGEDLNAAQSEVEDVDCCGPESDTSSFSSSPVTVLVLLEVLRWLSLPSLPRLFPLLVFALALPLSSS